MGPKANETILKNINDDLKEMNSRNFIQHAATSKIEDSMDLMNNDLGSNHSNSSKGLAALNRKYVSVRNDREDQKTKLIGGQDEEHAVNKSQSLTKQDQIDILFQAGSSSATPKQHTNILNAIGKRKMT